MADPDPDPGPASWVTRNRSRAEGTWYLRHRATLARWPLLSEPWAQRVDAARLIAEAPARGDRLAFLG